MNVCKIVDSVYIPSESITFQGDWKKTQKYKDKGYKVKELGKGNGNWIATKPAQALFTLNCENENHKVNLTYEIKDYYDKKKMTETLFDKFVNEINKEKMTIYFSEGNEFIIK
ncbi:MAG: hypothetical protein K0R54_824 [Clostridiaceae bacterium]|nr:hypothetical protein [Clostridiaceae bacterium]